MHFIFSLSEGLKSLFKARLATTISVVSVTFTLLLLGIFFISFLNLNQWITSIRNKVGLEVFLRNDITAGQINKLKSSILELDGVAAVTYISKNEASIRFKKEFGYDINEVLSFNPLPPSFTLELKEGYRNSKEIAKLSNVLRSMAPIEDVVYQEMVITLIDKYVQIIIFVISVIGVIIIIIAYALIFNTIRLTIFARRDIIQIMRLVGATTAFIKRPFIIEGVIQGIIGATFASSFLYVTTYLIRDMFFRQLVVDYHIFIILYALGSIIGWISANMSVQKYLHRV
jgi:cell division transport system permease protein